MKTIRQWLEGIKDKKVREQALKNADKMRLKEEELMPSLFAAIDNAFVWTGTPEGHDYWHRATKNNP